MKKLVLAALLLLLGQAANSSVFTGEQLMKALEDSEQKDFAQGYVIGAFDIQDGVAHCVPAGVKHWTIIQMVHTYLVENPQVRQLQGDLLVTMLISSKYPCHKPPPQAPT